MKNKLSLFCKAVLLLAAGLLGCEEKVTLKRTTPNLSFLEAKNGQKENSPGRVQSVDWRYQLLAFQGDDLYSFHSDTRTWEHLGTGWTGTEAVTVFDGFIFGVQADHLWRCNLVNGSCADLGPNWTGTAFMTNDDDYLYAVQGNRLWKVNTNGGFSQLGQGEWGGATGLGFSYGAWIHPNAYPWLYIRWSGVMWRVSRSDGSWQQQGAHAQDPYITPMWWADDDRLTIGVLNGQLTKCDIEGCPIPKVIAAGDWTGTTDLAITTDCVDNCSSQTRLYLLKDSQIHEFTEDPHWPHNYSYAGVIPGLSAVYNITSMTTR